MRWRPASTAFRSAATCADGLTIACIAAVSPRDHAARNAAARSWLRSGEPPPSEAVGAGGEQRQHQHGDADGQDGGRGGAGDGRRVHGLRPGPRCRSRRCAGAR